MKVVVTVLCLLFPVVAAAQNQGMNGVDMQLMMQKMQEMQQCMAKVDQGELQALEEKSEQFEQELKTLCANGERDKAQKKAMAYSMEMAKNPTLAELKKCGEITKGLVPQQDSMNDYDEDFDFSNRHVCDEY